MMKHSIDKYSDLLSCAAIIFVLLCATPLYAQYKDAPQEINVNNEQVSRPKNVKILDEHRDAKGDLVRTIQYSQGYVRVTETIYLPRRTFIGRHVPIDKDTINQNLLTILVDKSHYCVEVFYRKKMIRAYKAVFGPHPLSNKCMEGDRCTPEGWFRIASMNPHSKYNKFMGLNYPNDTTRYRFEAMKTSGQLPANAHIGGSIGIHGIWPGGDDMIEMGVGWTDGCIAMKNRDVDDLYSLVSIGTRVHIIKN